MNAGLTLVGAAVAVVAVASAVALVAFDPADDADHSTHSDQLTPMANQTMNTSLLNGTLEKHWFNDTFDFSFTQYRTPVTGPRHDIYIPQPVGEFIPLGDAANCLGFFDATNGTRFAEAMITITWDVGQGPETLEARVSNASAYNPIIQAEGLARSF